MGVAATNVGRRDLSAGVDFVADLDAELGAPWVSANLRRIDGTFPFPRWRTVEWEGLRVLITGVLPPDPRADPRLDIEVQEPAQAVREVLEQARRKGEPDLVVCLSTLGIPAEQQLARAVPQIQVIIGGGDRQRLLDPVVEGNTAIFHAADRGRFVGVLEIEAAALAAWRAPRTRHMRRVLEDQLVGVQSSLERATNPAQRRQLEARQAELMEQLAAPDTEGTLVENRLIALNSTLNDDPEVAAWVGEWKADAARRRPQPLSSGPGPSRRPPPGAGEPGRYAGTGACRPCHSQAYRVWASTPHARAYVTLRGRPRSAECLQCHAARLQRRGGTSLEPLVGCESCHGPGGRHRGPGDIERSPAETTCRTCHRGFHPDEEFVFGEDYEKIRCDR